MPSEFLIRFGILLMALLSVTVLIYLPGLSGPLIFDDYTNLSPLGDDGGISSWSAARNFVFGNASGPTGRPVSMLSFLIDAQNWPPHIAALKYTNILIHALTGCLLCWFAFELFQLAGLSAERSALMGLLVAALWLLHPFNSSTTLYVVQRMTQLMTLFGLAALILYLKGRRLIAVEPRRALLLCLSLFPFALLSVLSKENGSLFLLLVLVCEFTVFAAATRSRALRLWLIIGIGAPLAVLVLYLLLSFPAALEGFDYRHFSMLERLLTESRLLLGYLSKILLPFAAEVGLFHDDLQISTSLLQPLTTLFSLLLLGALAAAAFLWRKSQPMFAFGVLWFFAMHLLESTYLPLELYFEHRNYMSMIGPLISCVWYLQQLLASASATLYKRVALAAVAVCVLNMSWLTWQQARLWGHTGNLYAAWADEQPQSIRAQTTYADFLSINGDPEQGMRRLELAHANNPREITVMLHMFNNACDYGLSAPYSLEQIANRADLEYYHNDINFHLTRLLENLLLGKCAYPEPQAMLSLFERVNGLPLADDRRASFHYLYSDLFVHYRQLNPALIQLRYAFDLNPIPQIPIRQALLSASAGNNEDALVFLERAKAADAAQSILLPSFAAEIARIEADIRSRMNGR